MNFNSKLLHKSPLILLPLFVMSACSTTPVQETTRKIREFKNNVAFLCATTQMGYTNKRFVQKSHGWSIYKNRYFKKGEDLMNIMVCESSSESE